MTEQEAVYTHCRTRQAQGREIAHGVARTIGAWWHDGRIRDTIAFSSTGFIAEGLTLYTFHEGAYDRQSADDRLALDMLGTYLTARQMRGETDKVPGWSDMWADKIPPDDDEDDETPGCEGHVDTDDALTSGAGIGEPVYCDGSCNPPADRRP